MAGQVMEAPMHQQAPMLQANCKADFHHLASTTMLLASSGAAPEMASYLQRLQAAAEANGNSSNNSSNGARGEQCPRCASHDTKFCYYNNYNTSQPRHFCRACRRYWTLGGSLRNVPIGGSTRKRPRLAPPQPPTTRRHPLHHVFQHAAASSSNPMPPPPSSQGGGLLGSLFALGAAAPLLEGRGPGFDLGLGLPCPLPIPAGGAGELGAQMQGLGIRGGGTSALLWPAGLLDSDGMDAWKVPGAGAPTWADFSAAAAPHQQVGGLLQGGAAQLM